LPRGHFPAPFEILAMGKVWQTGEVKAWAKDHGRLTDS
jgi:predicted DNA-binding transcriptional regulator AlpA